MCWFCNCGRSTQQKLLHRVVSVFIFDVDGFLYLQAGNKYSKIDLPIRGHVQQGETYEIAAEKDFHDWVEFAEKMNLQN